MAKIILEKVYRLNLDDASNGEIVLHKDKVVFTGAKMRDVECSMRPSKDEAWEGVIFDLEQIHSFIEDGTIMVK